MDFLQNLELYGVTARIKRISDTLMHDARRVYEHLGLPIEPNWHLIFLLLKKEEQLSVTEISKALNFSHPAVINIIKKMKQAGYVTGTSDKSDSRKQLIQLTEKAKKELPLFERKWDKIEIAVGELFSDAFLKQVSLVEQKMKERSLLSRVEDIIAENAYEVTNTTLDDLEFVYWMYQEAIKYQKKNKYISWEEMDRDFLLKEIKNNQQFKMVKSSEIICVWGVVFSDPLIWREKDTGNSIFLHRAVVNPKYRGQRSFAKILNWAIDYCKQHSLDSIKMDTWSSNPDIIEFYKKYGFHVVEEYKTGNSKDLPKQHRNLDVTLLEYPIA